MKIVRLENENPLRDIAIWLSDLSNSPNFIQLLFFDDLKNELIRKKTQLEYVLKELPQDTYEGKKAVIEIKSSISVINNLLDENSKDYKNAISRATNNITDVANYIESIGLMIDSEMKLSKNPNLIAFNPNLIANKDEKSITRMGRLKKLIEEKNIEESISMFDELALMSKLK